MRVARFSSVLLPLVFVSAVSAPHSFADPASTAAADSTARPLGPPPPRCIWDRPVLVVEPGARMVRGDAPAASAPPPAVTIVLTRGDSVEAAYVGPWSVDAVRVWTVDGKTRYLPHHRVRAVTDAEGRDRTRDVIEGRKTIGITGEGSAPSLKEWVFAPFHGWPLDDRRDYVITEWSVLARDTRPGGMKNSLTRVMVSIGGMKNLSRKWAVGGVLQLSRGDLEYRDASLGLRLKRSFVGPFDLEVTPGVFAPGSDGWKAHGLPLYGEVEVSMSDALALVARFEHVRYEGQGYAWDPWSNWRGTEVRRRTESTWSFGTRIGPSPRWLSVPGLVVGFLWFAMPSGTSSY